MWSDSLEALQESVSEEHDEINAKLSAILALLAGADNCTDGSDNGGEETTTTGVGVNYKRWGRTECPENATLIYEGT